MKVTPRVYPTSKAFRVGLTLLFISQSFVGAAADDVGANRIAEPVVVLESPHRENELAKVVSGEQPTTEESASTSENRPSQIFPVPSPNRSLLGMICSNSAKGLAALRLVEKGRVLLKAREDEKALAALEQALSLEANPYVYFYLAEAHYQLGNYYAALNFLEAAEGWLDQEPDWTPEITSLKAQIPGSGFVQQTLSGQITMVAQH
jgi:tetratricopeptide (TPR) repeat protein